MPKRRLTLEDQRREVRDKAFRQVRSLLDVYWQMCGTFAAADTFDARLAMRMLRHRERVLRLVEFLMPEPRLGELLDAGEASDSHSVH
jgi:hypothetical protein